MPPHVAAILSFLGIAVVATKGLADHLEHGNREREYGRRIHDLESQVASLYASTAWSAQAAAEAQEQLRGVKSLLLIRRNDIDALRVQLAEVSDKPIEEVPDDHDGESSEGH